MAVLGEPGELTSRARCEQNLYHKVEIVEGAIVPPASWIRYLAGPGWHSTLEMLSPADKETQLRPLELWRVPHSKCPANRATGQGHSVYWRCLPNGPGQDLP